MRKIGYTAIIALIGGVALDAPLSSPASTRTVTTTDLAVPASLDMGGHAASIDMVFSSAAMWR
ncbi:MAG: hypothetical protein HXX10_20855 [Rhodoplanes sp.]|uniref:hypothetical protein n=1 Tax=Rhodoplanes sp. TaxID=1968906 RepID=UPI0017E1706F|nr:hypothetical protein [Rhodoplanes sp.]NVO16485.1 hypothetical protein [Rhodoplanes sp.]